MSDQASKDAAAKARVINHMNADHHDSVSTTKIGEVSISIDEGIQRSFVILRTTTIFLAGRLTTAKSPISRSTTLLSSVLV
jgi:hypothetical protein